MVMEARRWTSDPLNEKLAVCLAELVKGVKSGSITTEYRTTAAGTKTSAVYKGYEIKDSNPLLYQRALATRGHFMKKDVGGGTGGGACSRDSWRIIALFSSENDIIPGYEFYWKHSKDVWHLEPGFLTYAVVKLKNGS